MNNCYFFTNLDYILLSHSLIFFLGVKLTINYVIKFGIQFSLGSTLYRTTIHFFVVDNLITITLRMQNLNPNSLHRRKREIKNATILLYGS